MITFPKNETLDELSPVTVVFRRWPSGEILALFPFVPASITNHNDDCMAYEHKGQHGSADYWHCIETTTPPTVADGPAIGSLVHELTERGYTIDITSHEALVATQLANAL